ncbi:MAG: nitroreductase family protein, partial [Lentimicrobiaceae bacterium]
MDFSELVKLRQSDRKYSDRPVEKEKIQQCIETARLSPSANNSQPWKFVIVD